MTLRIDVDMDEVARAAQSHGVRRLQVFGSAVSDDFDPASSDIDLLVEFEAGGVDLFDAYFGLKEELERIFARPVDVVMASAVRNPHFMARVASSAEDLYAA